MNFKWTALETTGGTLRHASTGFSSAEVLQALEPPTPRSSRTTESIELRDREREREHKRDRRRTKERERERKRERGPGWPCWRVSLGQVPEVLGKAVCLWWRACAWSWASGTCPWASGWTAWGRRGASAAPLQTTGVRSEKWVFINIYQGRAEEATTTTTLQH